jgi:hypothetical protein
MWDMRGLWRTPVYTSSIGPEMQLYRHAIVVQPAHQCMTKGRWLMGVPLIFIYLHMAYPNAKILFLSDSIDEVA